MRQRIANALHAAAHRLDPSPDCACRVRAYLAVAAARRNEELMAAHRRRIAEGER